MDAKTNKGKEESSEIKGLLRFFSLCAGSDLKTLRKCSLKEQNRHAGIGATIFMTGLLASVSGGYAFYRVFHQEEDVMTAIYLAVVFGLIWGLLIFNLDRFLVMSMSKQGGIWQQVFMAFPRFMMAVLISVVIAKPIEVRLFEDRIQKQLLNNQYTAREKAKEENGEWYQLASIKAKIAQLDSLVIKIDTSLATPAKQYEIKEGRLETLACQEELASLREKNEGRINQYNRQIQGLVAEIEGIQFQITTATVALRDAGQSPEEKRQTKREKEAKERLLIQKKNIRRQVYKSINEVREILTKQEEKCGVLKKTLAVQEGDYYGNLKEEKGNIIRKRDSLERVLNQRRKDFEASLAQDSLLIQLAFRPTLISQIEALSQITSWDDTSGGQNSLWWTGRLISLLFILIECSPVLVKLISSEGKYELLIEGELNTDKINKIKVERKAIELNIKDEISKTKELVDLALNQTLYLNKAIKEKKPLADEAQLERLLNDLTYQSIKDFYTSLRSKIDLSNPNPVHVAVDYKIKRLSAMIDAVPEGTIRERLIKHLMNLLIR